MLNQTNLINYKKSPYKNKRVKRFDCINLVKCENLNCKLLVGGLMKVPKKKKKQKRKRKERFISGKILWMYH